MCIRAGCFQLRPVQRTLRRGIIYLFKTFRSPPTTTGDDLYVAGSTATTIGALSCWSPQESAATSGSDLHQIQPRNSSRDPTAYGFLSSCQSHCECSEVHEAALRAVSSWQATVNVACDQGVGAASKGQPDGVKHGVSHLHTTSFMFSNGRIVFTR